MSTAVPLYSLSLSLSRDVKTASARNPQTSRLPQPRANSPKAKPNKDMADVARRAQDPVLVMDANELARRLHQSSGYFLLDCRPVLAFNSSHISGAVNINFTNMMKKRFLSGKIGLADLVTSEEGKEKFKTVIEMREGDLLTVVYDDATSDLHSLSCSSAMLLVIRALEKMGKCPYLLLGGLDEFGVLHPSLCEVSIPTYKKSVLHGPLRPTTPGVREQAMDWETAPPVHVLSYLVLGSEKDAKNNMVMREYNIGYVLNVTPKCPNMFEDEGIVYKRIAVSDTGSQKLSHHFLEAFDFIEMARNSGRCVLIHCMAGVSRSVTLTIAYLMYHYRMSMHNAYQFVKEKRPAISPNLNFMGQLVEFERELELNPRASMLDLSLFLPSIEQEMLPERVRPRSANSSAHSSAENTPEPTKVTHSPVPQVHVTPFLLKAPGMRHKKGKGKAVEGSGNVSLPSNQHSPTIHQVAYKDTAGAKTPPCRISPVYLADRDESMMRGGGASSFVEKDSVGEKARGFPRSPILHEIEQKGSVGTVVRSFEHLSLKGNKPKIH